MLTRGCDDDDTRFSVYDVIAKVSSGEVFPLKDKNLIEPLLNFIRVSVSDHQVNLMSKTEISLERTSFDFYVDSCLEDLIVTVTLRRIQGQSMNRSPTIQKVDVYDPFNNQSAETVVDLNVAKVIKFTSPAKGLWRVFVSVRGGYVRGTYIRGSYNIRVSGSSVCNFEPSFVYSLAPTAFFRRPAKGMA